MKDIQIREERENMDTIGKVSPEIQEKRNTESIQTSNSKKMEQVRQEREEKDKAKDDLLIAIHGAKIKFNSHMGEFKVLNDVPTTQDKLTGTSIEKQILNFIFYDGFQMLSLTEWQDFGTVKIQDNFILLKKSTLQGTGKMPGNLPPESGKIEFVDSGQVNMPESINAIGAPILSSTTILKKFMIHFRRPSSYNGEYGFDWLRDEYINPITIINGINKELSLDISKLKTEYKTTDVTNPISPYSKDYYCSFLNLMLNQEVILDIEVEELEALTTDATEIMFESSNSDLTITPANIPLSTLISGGKQNKDLNLNTPRTTTRDYYLATNKVKVKCNKAFAKNEQIKIFAKLKDPATGIEDKKEVGKMMVMKNNEQAKYTINVYVIKAFLLDDPAFDKSIIDAKISALGGLQVIEDYLNKQSLNQALIQVKLIYDPIYDWENKKSTLVKVNDGKDPQNDTLTDEYSKYKGMITDVSNMLMHCGRYMDYINDRFEKKFSNFANKQGIFLYLTPFNSPTAGGASYTYPIKSKRIIMFNANLKDPQSYAHEIGHTLGLEHTFLDKDSSCNPISLTTERNKINQETNDYKRKIDETKRKVDADWLKYKQENNAYFTQYPSKIAEYRKPYDDNKVRLDKQFSDYEKKQNDRLSIITKNELRFIKASTDNIMDYSFETDCATPRPNILYRDTNQLISFYKNQWKITQDETQKYYH